MRSVINPNNVRERMTITGPVAMFGLAGMHIKHLRVIMDKRDPAQRHLLQDAKCDGLVIDKLEIIGKPDGSSKEAWIATDCKGAMITSPGVLLKHYYCEYVHMPLQLIGENSQCNAMEAFNVTGDAFQLCGNGTRLESAVIKGLLKIREYKVEHIDVGMLFYKARKGFEAAARVLKNAYVGNVTLLKSGHPFEDPMPQGIVCPDDSYENCRVENCTLPDVNPEHGVRFGHAINCTIENIKTNGAVAFGDRKPTKRVGRGNRIINCDSPTCVFEDGSECRSVQSHPPRILENGNTMNRKVFYDIARVDVFGGSMNADQVKGCEAMLDYWEQHHPRANKEWIAYSLATAFHETAHTMQPIKERGGREYYTRLYDVQGVKPERARKYGNVNPGDGARFCGRGLTQLTWHCNYDKQGKKHGLDLVGNPDLMLQMDVSVKVMIEAMIDGDFCWVKRGSDWHPASFDMFTADDGSFNEVDARRIINGTDKAQLIAGYHRRFLKCLEQSVEDEALEAELLQANAFDDSDYWEMSEPELADEKAPEADLDTLVEMLLKARPDLIKPAQPAGVTKPWLDEELPLTRESESRPVKAVTISSKPSHKSKTIWTAVATGAGFIATKVLGEQMGIPPEVLPYVESTIVTGGLTAIGFIRKFFTNTVLKG